MFETSQPEQNSKAGLIVGGAILVVMAAFGIFYLTHLSQEPETSSGSTTSTAAAAPATPADLGSANPMIDLQILQQSLGRDNQTQTMAMWNLRLVNRNRAVAYKNIQYETNYYDAQQNLLSTRGGTLPGVLSPSDQKTFSQVNDGLYPVGTASFTIGIKAAEASQP
jgi:hypothetical protein